MLRAYKYELAPTSEQANHLNRIMGSCRFVYNLALDTKIQAYSKGVSVNCFELMKQLTDLKTECDWLYESPTHALQHAIINLDNAFTNFFKGRAKFPRFKSKKHRQSFHIPAGTKVDWDRTDARASLVFFPKIKWVKLIVSRKFNGTIRNATVSKTPMGKYFVSILVETGQAVPAKAPMVQQTTVGVDVGLKHFATLSDGTKIDNPKFLFHSLKRLRVEQRTMKRRFKKGVKEQSKGYQKQKSVVARLHERVANQRKDFLHKTSTAIVKQYDTIVLEDLNIKGMVKNPHLSRAISDVGWSMFEGFIRYKCEWQGKNFEQIGRFEPSSKICSTCGHHKGELLLSEREWRCLKCETKHDRDLNAAINIRDLGLRAILPGGDSSVKR